jgi:hypothetical protein
MGHSRYVYSIDGPNNFTLKIENSKDGKEWATFMEGKYARTD